MSNHPEIDAWFKMRFSMLPAKPSEARPPSLRAAIYASLRLDDAGSWDQDTLSSFVNGIELGCMTALKEAWEEKHGKIGE